ncbi:hypothetical protein GCM10007198_09530 [Microbacterium aerolatum]|uniref:Uncharacterized protein n=1 Tax=Microbacterium aerolatum TaxID=153731 RepID=A0A511ABY6_9MICO|nr:hypothetical protein MAE01_08640 [Microbacterium aerolatum]GGB21164.1 hypothetical protein GCM10007198_09530 [Microbacterium aerolatum]
MTRTDLTTTAVRARQGLAAAWSHEDPHLTLDGLRAYQSAEVARIRATLHAAMPAEPTMPDRGPVLDTLRPSTADDHATPRPRLSLQSPCLSCARPDAFAPEIDLAGTQSWIRLRLEAGAESKGARSRAARRRLRTRVFIDHGESSRVTDPGGTGGSCITA